MKPCQDYLSELREKNHHAEDHLRAEKKNLYRVHEMFTEEKDKWAAEIKEEEVKIQLSKVQVEEKEEKLGELKASYEEVVKKCDLLEVENEKLRREVQKAKTYQQDRLNKFLLEQGNLEKELSRVQELLAEAKLSNKWAKIFQEKELKAQENENEALLKEDLKQLSDEFAKKVEAFDEELKEIDKAILVPKRERLASLMEKLRQLTAECDDMARKNKELERQIELLNSQGNASSLPAPL